MDDILDQLGLADLKIAFKDNKVKILKIKYKRCVSCILTVSYQKSMFYVVCNNLIFINKPL